MRRWSAFRGWGFARVCLHRAHSTLFIAEQNSETVHGDAGAVSPGKQSRGK